MTGDGPVLRLVDRPRRQGGRTVVVSWRALRTVPREATVEVTLQVDPVVAEKLRWYLEDYGEFPAEPAPTIAAETERIVAALGRQLFEAVFCEGDAREIWAQARLAGLAAVRVEVDADPADVPGLPWELLRDPGTDRPLVVAAGQFVRTHHQAAVAASVPEADREHLRVLLVICRPDGRDDVAFRSVASRLVRGGADRLPGLELDVLRPATFPRLWKVLQEARDAGRPYHVVHFDGHGDYLDVEHLDNEGDPGDAAGTVRSPLRYGISLAGPVRPGRHGYLLFENPAWGANQQLVDGSTLAGLLVETGVPVLVLNACRSAYAEAPRTPRTATQATVHDRVRAYGSLAAEVADAGMPGVVAMRYNVYVVTAAQFVADLYTALLAGRSLGRAATVARQALAADPTRHIGAEPVALQDWVVPTVYEAVPLTLLTPAAAGGQPSRRITVGGSGTPVSDAVPRPPDVGFFGRDETLLALDRAFDTHRVVLLHAFAGAGKTSTAAEFARWYSSTGGVDDADGNPGPVLWTSFEHHLPLPRVLDVVGAAFAPLLEANGILWAAITDPVVRRDLVLQVLTAVPVLWVWDNVEPVAGFPAGTTSAWSPDEQNELVDLLRDLTATRAKVLLTSRRPEDRWLGGLAVRVQLPPMPMRERLQLTNALVRHLAPDNPPGGARAVDWRPLLRFTGGNPLTIAVAVRQALREAVTSTDRVERFVTRVQAGHTALEDEDDAAQGRDASLAASLTYGFDHAFTEPERARLALLHLFRDTAHVGTLELMGNPELVQTDVVPALNGSDYAGLTALLDRAVDVGLLTGYGGGYYGIHPALPWFFTTLFITCHGEPTSETAEAAERAYARAYSVAGTYYFTRVEEGRAKDVLSALRAEEANLINGLALARTHRSYLAGVGCLQGLYQLYKLTGRGVEWARLVTDVEGDYYDPGTGLPLPGRDDEYGVVVGYRLGIARAQRDWVTAGRLHTARTDWVRDRAAPYRDLPTEQLDALARVHLRNLVASETDHGQLLEDQDDPACLDHYRFAHDLCERIGDTVGQAMQASNLGNAYLSVTAVQDLDQAQRWHQRDLDLKSDDDRIGRAAAHISLAAVARRRYLDAPATAVPADELSSHLTTARAECHQALDLLPADHHEYRAAVHNQLGTVYQHAGDVPRALHHYQQSLHHREARGDTYGAGQTRYNITLLLADAGRVGDALHYARAALANYRQLGPGASDRIEAVEEIINELGAMVGSSRSP